MKLFVPLATQRLKNNSGKIKNTALFNYEAVFFLFSHMDIFIDFFR